jgi:hypothetical protein
MRNHNSSFGDFSCAHCHSLVSAAHMLSGVNNRNHCPYCLWSRHLDLFAAGDRLSACKAPMRPVALTMKRSRNKYSTDRGELMLVHICSQCGAASINRIAADDVPELIMTILAGSFSLPSQTRNLLSQNGIDALGGESLPLVREQLFGRGARLHVQGVVEVE